MIIAAIIFATVVISIYLVFLQPQFGQKPSGAKLEKIKKSSNYKNGQFQNMSTTPQLTDGAGIVKVMTKFFFHKDKRNVPVKSLSSEKTDLFHLGPDENVLVWFGHSSYFMQIDGKKFLVDPVLCGHASPVKFSTKSFKGSDIYTIENIPEIDFLVITHDHYDHLDYETMVQLKPKINKVITGLGIGSHLERWGYSSQMIFENDWNEEIRFGDFIFNATPARHFSGRSFKRNTTLWLSFVLTTPTKKIFIGGDSGYDTHFKMIGEKFGPFDLAILENGQYNQYWKFIHMMPEEVVQASEDLKAKRLLPVHWGKFSLSIHSWDEPISRVISEGVRKKINILHPMIGQTVYLDSGNLFTEWWRI